MALATCVATAVERHRSLPADAMSSHWLDLARAKPPAGHRRSFIQRAYAVLATLPRPLLIAVAGIGHRIMEARHLRGIQRRSTARTDAGGRVEQWRKPLLTCGILAGALYLAMTLFVGLLWDGYSAADQTISELSAIGAPTRPVWMALGTLYTGLMIAFGWVVWRAAPPQSAQRVLGMLLIATIAIVLACGAMTGTYASRVQADLPTPWVGVWERVSSTAYMLWIVVLAAMLLRTRSVARREADHVESIWLQDSRG